ncbi:PepSY-associated TM helix domain-containing protein [Dyella silvatica]|uniref:PepSY-associated TM helix domain-containing protein n=1 Tax=Dyella silvatica TaxID=2992128 RepID=UPI0022502538|nr:PepSY-associated TM helix domain-containing protein [Dyella silvatica]
MTSRPAAPSLTVVRRRFRWRDVLRTFHLWTGLSIGVLFAVLALSGSLLAFQMPLLRWQHPELTRYALPTMAQNAVVLERIYQTPWPTPARNADMPSAELPVWQLYLGGDVRVYLDPLDGHPLLTRSPQNDWLLWLRLLHTHLLGGKTGEQVLGVVGVIELCLLISGAVLWWPRRGHWRNSVRMYAQPPTRRWRSWHQSFGAVLLPLLLLSTVTGVLLIYKDSARSVLRTVFADHQADFKPPSPLAKQDAPIRWLDALTAAQAALPQSELRRISLPDAKNAALLIRARGPNEWNAVGRSTVVVDPYAGKVIAAYDADQQGTGAHVSDGIYPLHAGAVGGSAWRLVIALIGLLPAFFVTTGFLFWWTRTRRKRAALPG